jgi:type VI secretion system FHA domain protein
LVIIVERWQRMILTLEIVGHQSGLPGFSGGKQFGPNGGTIGRLPDNDWVLPDPYISGRHALIRYVGGKFYIEDISTNGVFLNAPDNRLQRSRPQLLEEGDRIYIDEYEIGVRFVEEASVAVPPPPQPQVQAQQRPFSPGPGSAAMPVAAPQPIPRPQPPPIARPQPQFKPPAPSQPQPQSMGMSVPPATMQMPVAPVSQSPSVEPIMVARPSAPPARPAPRRIAAPDNDLRLLGLDDRQPSSPAPVARVPDLLEMGRPSAASYPRNSDLMSASPQALPQGDAALDSYAVPDPNEQDDLSLASLREAISVAAAPPSLPPPVVPRATPLPGAGGNGNNGYRPLGANPLGSNAGAKLGTNGPNEMARKAGNSPADATLAFPPSTEPQNGSVAKTAGSSVIIPDDYDPLEDDLGSEATSELPNVMAPPPTNGAYNSGRMTMAQPPIAAPRRPAISQPVPSSKADLAPPPLPPRGGNPRTPSPPIVTPPAQQALPPMAPPAPQNVSVAPPQAPAPMPVPAKISAPVAPPPAASTAPPPPSIPVPTPGPAARGPANAAPGSTGVGRPIGGATARTEEPNRPMIPPPAVPRPMRPAVVPYPGRKPPVPAATNGMAAPQVQPSAESVPATTANAQLTPKTQPVANAQPADTGAMAAVLEAAGLQLSDVPPEFSSNLGRILRVAVAGMIEVLRAQQSIKDEFRMRMTAFKNVDNNPLKLSGTPEEALQSLFVGQNGNSSGPVEAFEEAFREVRNHELAMLDGMRVAYEFMLAEFDPDRVQEDFNSSSSRGSILGKSAKSRYWDFYREKYGEIVSDGEASFRNRFGDEFAKAYEEQLERLNALDRNRGK